MTDPREPGSEPGADGDGDGGESGDRANGGSNAECENDGSRFDRLPSSAEERRVAGRPTREEVLDWWATRYGIPRETFAEQSFWEKGSGKIWAFSGASPSPIAIEGLGLTFLRTRQDHWKPTTNAVQRFGHTATCNVLELSDGEARAFVAGHDQRVEWEGEWGYLIVARELAGEREPLGVGLYLHGELRSQVPKGRQREF